MHIEILGSGPDLVMIHGWAMHGGIFSPLVERLAERFRVHVPDLPGHGASHAESTFDVIDCAREIAARTPRAIWLGWSLGGIVALTAALDHVANVRGLIMIASTPRFVRADDWPHAVVSGTFGEFAAELKRDYRHAIERFLALEVIGSAHAQSELRELRHRVFERGEPNPGALEDGLRALDREDLRARVPALAMPSLWIAGRRDRLVPPAALAWSAARAPRARMLEINSGHAPFISHGADIANAIDAFAMELAT